MDKEGSESTTFDEKNPISEVEKKHKEDEALLTKAKAENLKEQGLSSVVEGSSSLLPKSSTLETSTEIDFENPQKKMKPEQPQPPPNVITPVWQKVAIPQGFKKVAIVGCADSRDQAPYDDPTFEIWGVNNLFLQLDLQQLAGRLRWFEQHTFAFDGLFFRRRGKKDFRGTPVAQYMTGLAQLGCPVYMQQPWPQIPNAVEYPIQKAIAQFGRYFTNTISYELALAIMLGFDEVHIYGVDMAVAEEFMNQRPSVEFFIGILVGMGKKVYIPDEADLCKSRFLYGYEEKFTEQFNAKINKTFGQMGVRYNKATQEAKTQELKAAEYRGAMGFAQEYQKIWGEVAEDAGLIPKVNYDIKFNWGEPKSEPILADIQSEKEVKPKE